MEFKEIAPDGAWTWFNDERACFHGDYLYAGYVRADGHVGLTRYHPPTGESASMQLSTEAARENDDHNNPSIVVLPDKRLLVTYSRHHKDEFFFWRVSHNLYPSRAEDWSPEMRRPTPSRTTYANTFRLSEEENRLYNFFRGINFNPAISISEDSGQSWSEAIHFIRSGTGRVRPYTRYCSNHRNRIDLLYTDGHPRDEKNSIYHLYYQGGGFHESTGQIIRPFTRLPIDHDAGRRGTVVYPYSEESSHPLSIPWGRAWVWDLHYDEKGNPVCVFQVLPYAAEGIGEMDILAWPHSRILYYYGRWTGSKWVCHRIANAGRGLYEEENFYAGGIAIDPENPGTVYLSSNARHPFDDLEPNREVPLNPEGRYELWRGESADKGETFQWEPITQNSSADNLRPIVPERHGCKRHLLWFQGRYTRYQDFDTRIMGIFDA